MTLPLRDLANRLGQEVENAMPVSGGCIHSAWLLRLADGRSLFAKSNRSDQLPVLEAERQGLLALAAVTDASLRIPRPRLCAEVGGQALLVMEALPLAKGAIGDRSWSSLGAALARLHRRSLQLGSAGFGWGTDNFIGAGVQCNGWADGWGTFFAERRLAPQFAWAAAKGLRFEGAAELLEQVPRWLDGHGAAPCLVHGDLWSGNAGVLEDGTGCVFDPAVHHGDREVDLAMARMFGGFSPAFFEGYEREWPSAGGHRQRAPLYNLYHLLNHANLFGGGYAAQVQRRVEELLSDPPLPP
jgi:fructosamine-3-kinase